MTRLFLLTVCAILFISVNPALGLERPDVEFKVFQFPRNMIPSMDGDFSDWDIVPDDHIIPGSDLYDYETEQPAVKGDLNVNVKVGWVNGLNRLYFLVEFNDDIVWLKDNSLHNDIFELVVDGDLSGGWLIKQENPNKGVVSVEDLHFSFHGVHAQNYHIFMPPGEKDWTMVWGCAQWIKDLPYANYAYSADVKQGESGTTMLEFWITPFDFAPYDTPASAIVSELKEDKVIGMSWAIIDYDSEGKNDGFYNLSHSRRMYGNTSLLCAFRLLPLAEMYVDPIKADWTFTVPDLDRRLVAFKDMSIGTITSWHWDFGDEATSTEQHPLHTFEKPGEKTVVLTVTGPDGTDRFARVWDVVVK